MNLFCFGVLAALLCISAEGVAEDASTCYGKTSMGRLLQGARIPGSGTNFATHSQLLGLLGRSYAHSTVRDIVVASYRALEVESPGVIFRYGEAGFQEGGLFRPHKTHQNGLSVDFMVPILNAEGESVPLPCGWLNLFGYGLHFDRDGKRGGDQIDFDAMGAHIVSLHKAAVALGADIDLVIFDPELQKLLLGSEHGSYLKEHIRFSRKSVWVRHDEHYHVNFKIPCEPL